MRVPGIPYVQGRNDYTDGDARKYGIAIHNTSNNASDEGEASYATWRPDGVSSHFYVDNNSVTQSIDTFDRAGHAGSTHGNDHGISVEITGGNGKSRSWWLSNVAWDELGRVLAVVIRHHWPDGAFQVRRASVAEMRRNPKVRAFYGHNDMRLAWGGTTHTDPGPNFPWDRLFRAVNEHLEEDDMPSFNDRIKVNQWITEKYGIERIAWGTAVTSGYGHARDAKMEGRKHAREILVGQAAILAAVAGQDPVAAMRAELQRAAERERAERASELGELEDLLREAAAERAALAELVRQGQTGEVEAAEVIRLLGERLTAAGDPADES